MPGKLVENKEALKNFEQIEVEGQGWGKPTHTRFPGGKGLGIQQRTSVWIVSPKSKDSWLGDTMTSEGFF